MSIGQKIWFRRTVIVVVVVVLIALAYVPVAGLFGSYRLKRATASADGLNLDPAAYEKPEIPAEKNAAKWIEAGAAAFVWSDEAGAVIADASLSPYLQWSAEQRAATRRVLAQQAGALETVHRAAGLRESNYGIAYRNGFGEDSPDFLQIIRAARVLMAEARLAEGDGDAQKTLLALRSMSRLAESLEEESAAIPVLIGIASERMLLVTMGEVVASDQGWAAQPEFLAELEGVIPTEDRTEMMGRTIDAWAAIVASGLPPRAWSFSDDRDTRFLSLPPFADLAGVEALRIRRRLMNLMGVPYGRSPELFTRPTEPSSLKPHKRAVFGDEGSFVVALSRAQSVAAQRMLVRASIQVRAIGASVGAYPSVRPSVDGLQEADPFTDRPLLYERRSDGSAVVALDNATPLLEQTILKLAADAVVPIVLPTPDQ